MTRASHSSGCVCSASVWPVLGATQSSTVSGEAPWMERAARGSSGMSPAAINRTGRPAAARTASRSVIGGLALVSRSANA